MTSIIRKWIPGLLASIPINLQPREKLIITAGGLALALILLSQLVVFPIVDHRTRLKNMIKSQSEALVDIQRLKSEYDQLTTASRRNELQLKQRQPGFNLYSFLESLAGRSGITRIGSMKPSNPAVKNSPYKISMVEMRIDGLTNDQMVAFLHEIETSKQMVWIKAISITREETKASLINMNLKVETIER